MASEIVVTIGADSKEFQRGLAIAKNEANKIPGSGGGGGAAAVGSSFLAMAGMVVDGFRSINSAIKGFLDESMEIRSMSTATGVSSTDLYEFKFMAEQLGMNLNNFTHSFSEFNKRMGEAKIKGSEMNALLAKLGISQDEVSSGSFTATKAFYELVKAYEAGTDAATLAYYGNVMFGSSFEQLLPAIKQGSASLKAYGKTVTSVSDESTRALGRLSDGWNGFVTNAVNSLREGAGKVAAVAIDISDSTQMQIDWIATRFQLTVDKGTPGFLRSDYDPVNDFAERTVRNMDASLSKAEREEYIKQSANMFPESEKADRDRFMKIVEGLQKTGGVKLTPLGLSSAQGASSLQQMGGGDIVSAIAFTPLERIATATEQTAANTDPKNASPLGQDKTESTYYPLGY